MKHYVVYHNQDSMGYSASEIKDLSVVTNKKVGSVEGDRVWILTGEGFPRKFYIVGTFIITAISPSGHKQFSARLSGTHGQIFDPIIEIGYEEWFDDFKRTQGNFAFGFQAIRKEQFVRGLEGACAKSIRIQ